MVVPHLKVSEDQIHEKVLLPGDPDRVRRIAEFLENSKKVNQNRGYVIYNGKYKGEPITVCNSNMGGPSTAIALHELNMCGAEIVIRVGSCGALQPDMRLGEVIVASQCVREEGTTDMYVDKTFPAVATREVYEKMVVECEKRDISFYKGTTRSSDSFYMEGNHRLEKFWSRVGLLGSDFETAPLFVVGELLGLKTGCILNIVDNQFKTLEEGEGSEEIVEEFGGELESQEARIQEGEEHCIKVALETIKEF